ncbi:putative entry exclusion protein TrbK-alt [Oceaniovalibus sp. ACAM 378]|uniref:putative entry exclusion protein TrbK-alt n=1 Tax=Oceaniovalibus sp. ACAM 378 TaxID=2599923 RepID=UPI0011DC15E4|nr:putative entry exclusion protein TrbK-alt [Oceaniovalibus sp. ACAM 378]TYB86078.1 putative entry exclusion protein TrbK-alt [Oceaniovalibus sp. ACAM 378]
MKRAVLIRLGTGVFVLFALLAALLEISRDDEIVIRPAPVTPEQTDLRQADLRRCQALGAAALEDPSCLDAWAEKRRDFLRSDPTSEREE